MNFESILHIPMSNYAYFSDESTFNIVLRAKKDDLKKVIIIYGNKYDMRLDDHRFSEEITNKYSDDLYDYFVFRKKLDDTRFGYVFLLSDGENKYYYCESGFSKDYDFSINHTSRFEYPYNFKENYLKLVPWVKDTVGYQIFPERFDIGDLSKDLSYKNMNVLDTPKSNSFYGGDLQGILNHIDYFKDLGINCLYLNPIFESPSNHKYDTVDYFKIDHNFGTNKFFKHFVDIMHQNGIKVILDGVFNHMSSDNKIFQDVVKKGKKSKYFNFFIIYGDEVDLESINYSCFATVKNMPRINTGNDEAIKYISKICTYWIKNYDIDGWRLDVSDEISFKCLRKIREDIKKVKEDAIIIGENWRIPSKFLQGDMLDSVMNYKFYSPLVDYLAFNKIDSEKFANRITTALFNSSMNANYMMMNQFENHDTHRLSSLANDKNAYILASAILLFYIGMPFFYYGSEIGIDGGYDPLCRKVMNWDKKDWDNKTFKTVKKLISIRKENECLKTGDFKAYSNDGLLFIERWIDDKKLTLIINNSSERKELKLKNKKPIYSYNFQDDHFYNKGFVIIN